MSWHWLVQTGITGNRNSIFRGTREESEITKASERRNERAVNSFLMKRKHIQIEDKCNGEAAGDNEN
jgi:hypothetical protein